MLDTRKEFYHAFSADSLSSLKNEKKLILLGTELAPFSAILGL